MKNHPDDRSDNVERIQENIDNTYQNIEAAEELIAVTDNSKTRRDLQKKNERRRDALDGLKQEIQDEARAREKKTRNKS
jgi:small acid-soluble spore protein (thioredoxin-like protein)